MKGGKVELKRKVGDENEKKVKMKVREKGIMKEKMEIGEGEWIMEVNEDEGIEEI